MLIHKSKLSPAITDMDHTNMHSSNPNNFNHSFKKERSNSLSHLSVQIPTTPTAAIQQQTAMSWKTFDLGK
jgi:hypothetical protein